MTLKMENRRINYQDLERRTTTTDRQKENCGNSKLYGNLEFHQNYHLLIRIPL